MRAWAKGLLCLEAAVGLLIGHGTWLDRQDFLDVAVEMITGPGRVMAFVDFTAAADSLAAGGLPCPVDLEDALTSMDAAGAVLVSDAVLHAAGARR
jgi:hypothetical protein